jgi:hypothetical protein
MTRFALMRLRLAKIFTRRAMRDGKLMLCRMTFPGWGTIL